MSCLITSYNIFPMSPLILEQMLLRQSSMFREASVAYMSTNKKEILNEYQRISSKEIDETVREEEKEQLYSIALFDFLEFANFVENNGAQVILELYNKLLELIHRMESNYGHLQEVLFLFRVQMTGK